MNIKIEKPTLDDAEIIAKYANNRKIWLNLTDTFPFPYKNSDAIAFLSIVNNENTEQVFKILKNGEFAGIIGLTPKTGVFSRNAEVGYWIAEPFWGQGICTEAVKQIVDFGFNSFMHLVRIYARVYHTNIGSMKVLEKSGFIKEAVIKREVFKADQFKDVHYYSISREYFDKMNDFKI